MKANTFALLLTTQLLTGTTLAGEEYRHLDATTPTPEERSQTQQQEQKQQEQRQSEDDAGTSHYYQKEKQHIRIKATDVTGRRG